MRAPTEKNGHGLRSRGCGARSASSVRPEKGVREGANVPRGSASMRKNLMLLGFLAFSVAGCGLENLLGTLGRSPDARPASTLQGWFPWAGVKTTSMVVTDGGGNTVVPFDTVIGADDSFTLKLPSSKYQFLRVQARLGDMETRTIVPSIGEESLVTGVDTDDRNVTETIIVEARLAHDGQTFQLLSPEVYQGTRTLIRAAFDVPGPTQDLLNMVGRIMPKADPLSATADPFFFRVPEVGSDWTVKSSPLDSGWIARNPFDYVGNGVVQTDTLALDAALVAAAKLYQPAGCIDRTRMRVVFSVDFNQGALNGNGGSIDRFRWAKDKPGKQMFFVGWVHKDSPVQDSKVNSDLGASTPNIVKMYDDGTNGDEVAGDNIWTVYFDVPLDPNPANVLRIGYKYTWGTRGAAWTGSEEWPGNSRIIEVVDVNGDGFVNRRDVFGDEATNKDNSNLSLSPRNTGSITWTTDLRGCGPEAREQKTTLHNAATCEQWLTPKSIGPITGACTGT